MSESQKIFATESEWLKKLVNMKLCSRNSLYKGGYDMLNQPEMRTIKTEISLSENGIFQIIEIIETIHSDLIRDKKANQKIYRNGMWRIVPVSPGKGILKLNFRDEPPQEIMVEVDVRGQYWLDGHRYCLERAG